MVICPDLGGLLWRGKRPREGLVSPGYGLVAWAAPLRICLPAAVNRPACRPDISVSFIQF